MDGDCVDLLSDSSSSDQTVLIETDDIDKIIQRYKTGSISTNLPPTSKTTDKNFYSLDEFSDDNLNESPRSCGTNSWQQNFAAQDFYEEDEDFEAVLDKIKQLESEPKEPLSKEVELLISGNLSECPKALSNGASDLSGSGSCKRDGLSTDVSYEELRVLPKKICKVNSVGGNSQRLEKEESKLVKALEKEQKKLEKEKEKRLKTALKEIEKYVKPDQCFQYLTINIDDNISNKHYGEVIKVGLKNSGYNFKVSKQLAPNLISWTRKVPKIENYSLHYVQEDEKQFLFIMDVPEFILHITNNTFIGCIQSLTSMPEISHLTIAILGLQRYYKHQNNKAAEVPTKNDAIEFRHLPKISKEEIENKLVEVQIFCKNIYIRPLEKFEDLAIFVGECSKSVAQIPYKMAKVDSLEQENEFFTVNNRDCVKIDKTGNGLGRLWGQFLRMFPLASLETAEAVTSVYPTIHSLMTAYRNCNSPEEAEKMLQNLPVRRAAGPLQGKRKLGPEFSKKAYRFFCSSENVFL